MDVFPDEYYDSMNLVLTIINFNMRLVEIAHQSHYAKELHLTYHTLSNMITFDISMQIYAI